VYGITHFINSLIRNLLSNMAPKSAVRYAILAATLIASIAGISLLNTEAALAATNSLTLPPPTDGVPTCGSVITKDVTLRSDLQCDKDGLIVGADGITINLNGHTITHNDGKNSNSAVDPTKIFGGNTGILVPNSNHIAVSGPGEISNFDTGIAFTGTSGGKVSDVILKNNKAGALILGSNNIEVSINTFSNNNYGVVSKSSQGDKVVFNSISGSKNQGIVFIDTDNSILAANNMFGNGQNGIFLDSQSSNNKIDYNNVFGQTTDINNANGLPPNVNNNDYGHNNNCMVSVPGGLCK
jgi:parallel beta-helix repeat protein